jgi:hypothetical protein
VRGFANFSWIVAAWLWVGLFRWWRLWGLRSGVGFIDSIIQACFRIRRIFSKARCVPEWEIGEFVRDVGIMRFFFWEVQAPVHHLRDVSFIVRVRPIFHGRWWFWCSFK